MKNMKKILILSLAALLLVAVSVGGTIAFLQDRTEEIVNTFTTSNIDITLDEGDELDLKMVPGKALTKDPVVTVIKGSEDCWLFVQIEKTDDFDTYLSYKMAEGWTELTGVTGVTGVYYRAVTASSTADQAFHVLEGDKVTVSTELTNNQMDSLEGNNNPEMTITAYAIQKLGFETDVAGAWAKVSTLNTNYVTPTTSNEGTKVTTTAGEGE